MKPLKTLSHLIKMRDWYKPNDNISNITHVMFNMDEFENINSPAGYCIEVYERDAVFAECFGSWIINISTIMDASIAGTFRSMDAAINHIHKYCEKNGIKILSEIEFQKLQLLR